MRFFIPLILSVTLFATGCGNSTQFIPGAFPNLPVGTVPPANDIALEIASTNAIRNDLTVADLAVDIALPADAPAANALYQLAMTDLDSYDADYAAGQAPTKDALTAVNQLLLEIRSIKTAPSSPTKSAALAHGASVIASTKPAQ